MIRIALAAAMAASFALALPASAETVIRIGYPGVGLDDRPFGSGDSAAVAHVGKYVQAEFASIPDVKVTWTFFRGAGPALNESLAAGHLDFAAGLGDLPSIVGRSRGLPTRFLAAIDAHDPIYLAVPPNSPIKTIEDLRGHKVAQFRGTNLQIATDRVLEAHGLTERNIQFVGLDMNASTSALVSGAVDASFGGNEYLDLQKRGIVRVIYSTKGDNPTLGRGDALFVTEAFEHAHPDYTQKVVTAFVKAARFTADEANRQAVFAIWAKSGLPAESFAEDFSGERLAHRVSPVIDPYIVARYKDQAARARAYGLIKKPVDIDSWFDKQFLDTALHDLKLEHYWPTYAPDGTKLTDGDVERSPAPAVN